MIVFLQTTLTVGAEHRHWTVDEGLPTGEVQQIVELPNGQMLVNCEGVFCLSDGAGFQVVDCKIGRCYELPHYGNRYGYLWQGDSLLWLRDFYRIYLFDARKQVFRYDLKERIKDGRLRQFATSDLGMLTLTVDQQQKIDSLGLLPIFSTVAKDRQGGLWIGTRNNGIYYLSPREIAMRVLATDDEQITSARSYIDQSGQLWQCKANGLVCGKMCYHTGNVEGLPYNRTTFITQLSAHRYLLCDSLSTLGYLVLDKKPVFLPLNGKIPALQNYRHMVGACPVDEKTVLVYSQNGAFLLDTRTDTMMPFPPSAEIGRYATKFNCVVKDHEGQLWIGTQNGLFMVVLPDFRKGEEEYLVKRVEGLPNNCIRSLVTDRNGSVWAGTSQGVSRITPTIVNLGAEDGVPKKPMMERAAALMPDGQLVFVRGDGRGLLFLPEQIITNEKPLPVVLTECKVNGRKMGMETTELPYYENYLAFSFSTLDYAAPSHTHYRYRLVPLEKEWNYSSGGSGAASVAYTALPPDSYLFEVQAATTTDEWGPLTQMTLKILPPWWLTWWAKMLYVLLMTGILVLTAGYWLKKRKEKMERENDERVNRLFELRSEARHQFAQSTNITPEKITTNKEEQLLVEQLLKAIAEHIDDSDYTIDVLAGDVAMSRSSLYKKMQTMLGITPNEFLRNVRLKHAAKLLAETDTPVNQVSLMVGFQTPRYFSQCFKQLFGVFPTEYREGSSGKEA